MPLKKLKEEEKASTQALLAAIEHKDRRFRLFQTLFMVSTFILLAVIISAQQRTLDDISRQQNQAEQIARDDAKRSEDSDNKVIRRLNCMVVFFSKTDRSNLSIDDIDKCTLNRDKDVQQFFAEPEETPAEQPPNLPDSAPTGNSDNGGARPTTPSNNGSNGGGETPPAENPPVSVDLPLLPPIPLCVPITGICIR